VESGELSEPTGKPGAKKSLTPRPSESPTAKSGAKEETDAKKEATSKRIEKVEPAKPSPPVEKPPKTLLEPTRTPAPEQPAHARAGNSSSCTTAAHGRATRELSIIITARSGECGMDWPTISSLATEHHHAMGRSKSGIAGVVRLTAATSTAII